MDAEELNKANLEAADCLAVDAFAKRLRDHANYFDEAGEYERMRDLDAARQVILALKPVLFDMRENGPSDGYVRVGAKAAEDLLKTMFG